MQPGNKKEADTLRERLIFQAVLLALGGGAVWLNAAALFAWGSTKAAPVAEAAPDGAPEAGAYLPKDTQLCTSTSAMAACLTIPAGSPVEVLERSGAQSYVRAGGFSGYVRTSAIKQGK